LVQCISVSARVHMSIYSYDRGCILHVLLVSVRSMV